MAALCSWVLSLRFGRNFSSMLLPEFFELFLVSLRFEVSFVLSPSPVMSLLCFVSRWVQFALGWVLLPFLDSPAYSLRRPRCCVLLVSSTAHWEPPCPVASRLSNPDGIG
uniref:Uncharacterized protein n=1 Tax=Arundo donax TaxID=35708 RepID=A0A0A9D383_ARUDO